MRSSDAAERRAAESGYRYVGERELREREWADLRGDADEIAPDPESFEKLCALLAAGDLTIVNNPKALKTACRSPKKTGLRMSRKEQLERKREQGKRYWRSLSVEKRDARREGTRARYRVNQRIELERARAYREENRESMRAADRARWAAMSSEGRARKNALARARNAKLSTSEKRARARRIGKEALRRRKAYEKEYRRKNAARLAEKKRLRRQRRKAMAIRS